ncbi:MAG: hypothetical protein JEZ07_16630 [Phycisphaerae bacterium]|nr:hypothetical protein [Phycisphaerae bacterium]
MNEKVEKCISDYVELYGAIQDKTDSDEVSIVILQKIGKDRRTREISAREKASSALASDKQKKWLKDLGVEFMQNC